MGWTNPEEGAELGSLDQSEVGLKARYWADIGESGKA